MKIYKKNLLIFLCCFIIFMLFYVIFLSVDINKKITLLCINENKSLFLAPSSEQEIEDELNKNIENQLKDIDFNKINDLINNLDDNQKEFFASTNFLSVVKNFIKGKSPISIGNFSKTFSTILINIIKKVLPYFCLILVIGILYSIIQHFAIDRNISTKNITYIVCFCSIAVVVLKLFLGLLNITSNVIDSISAQMEVIFPILLTITTSIGGVATASGFQPILSSLSVIITKIFVSILLPIIIFIFVFNIVGNINENVKLDNFSKLFSSVFNWVIGIVFTVFIAFLTINGLTASSLDGISLKTAKYAIKSYIPILGSYLSDGVGIIISSSMIIKNSIGATGLLLIVSSVISPIINILVCMLLFKLCASLFEILSVNKLSKCMLAISKSLSMLNICLLAIGFMYIISTSILLVCSNIF